VLRTSYRSITELAPYQPRSVGVAVSEFMTSFTAVAGHRSHLSEGVSDFAALSTTVPPCATVNAAVLIVGASLTSVTVIGAGEGRKAERRAAARAERGQVDVAALATRGRAGLVQAWKVRLAVVPVTPFGTKRTRSLGRNSSA